MIEINWILTDNATMEARVPALKRMFLLIQRSLFVLLMFMVTACMDPGQFLVLDGARVTEESETQSVMRDLAASISIIEDASVADISATDQRDIIFGELYTLQQLAEKLQQDALIIESLSATDDHSSIRVYLERLSADVNSAIDEMSQPAPDLYIAGRIAGACLACHESLWVSR